MNIIPALVATSFLSAYTCPAQPFDPYKDVMAGVTMNAAKAAELETALDAKPDDLSAARNLLSAGGP